MKKYLDVLFLTGLCLVAIAWFYPFQNTPQKEFVSITSKPLSNAFLSQNIPLIDIRTKKEWHETGIIPKSHLITFYNEDNSYDENTFLKELETIVTKKDTFVILCRSGNRSMKVTKFLTSQGYSHVINLSGGIKEAIKNGITTIPYTQ